MGVAQIASLVNIAGSVLNCGTSPKRRGTAHESIVPYQVFWAKDGDLVIAAMSDAQFVDLCVAFGIPDVAQDPRFKRNRDRVANRKECVAMVQEQVARFTRDECLKLMQAANVTSAPVNSVSEALRDPQVMHRDMIVHVEHPTAGTVKMTGCPVKFSETPCSIRKPPPILGQHTSEVMKEFGIS
jgi:crotonobetainyl-CoA:carnitine CoA-transferase CaiB-like acyl-CoA transferase